MAPPSPVLIVGAGPTGLTLANALLTLGIPFRIVDKLAAPATVSKALAVWSGSLEAFGALGLAERFIADGMRMETLRIGDNSHPLAAMPIAEGVDSPYPFTLILPQSRTEAILTERLAESGIAVERGVELLGFTEAGRVVEARLRHPDGEEEEAACSFLVGSDGARSAVRRGLDIPFEGFTEPQTFILSDTQMDGPLDPSSIYIWWSAAGSVALFPVTPGVWRTFAMREDPASDEPPTLEEIQRHLTASGLGVVAHDPTWLSAFRVNERLVASYGRGRVFLAGDAAHIHSPAGGQGMNTGIQDAMNLGWKLAAVLSGRGVADALLGSYEAERRPVARAVVAGAAQKLRFGMVSTSTATRVVRDALVSVASRLPVVRRKLQAELSETDIVYDSGPLLEAVERLSTSGAPASGHRARDAALGDARLWSRFSGARHTLLLLGPPGAHGALRAHAARIGSALGIEESEAPELLQRYGFSEPGWVLVRPDQFIAARGPARDDRAFLAYARLALEPAAE
ncbi:FAD-dependent monooxygenase [Aquabacter sp. L1I39]|uniref:FAD-dependent monooxygenase n=1 Tax=Aquabacter sp. L1I39 TaxID=2820278 RepID=UPI001ADC93D5|nr:FAD-dependent monooxygenase [Aquabacter sp. L1I39]QTL02823.1 FAD-dependent monooxygenase [Aquabacter sp. L1I39]